MITEQDQRKLDRQCEIVFGIKGTAKVGKSVAKKIYHLGNVINRTERLGHGYSAEGLLEFTERLPAGCRFADVDEMVAELVKALGPYRAATIGVYNIHIADETNHRRVKPYNFYYVFTLNVLNYRIFEEQARQENVLYW